mmetsp:Transcript_29466/g.45572  ORF Transcript_29466/g.45572 Transcript_29466/m.45572 type:complete len:368 (-) Transcript_29466:30-1133(-)
MNTTLSTLQSHSILFNFVNFIVSDSLMFSSAQELFQTLQTEICRDIEAMETEVKFTIDRWTKEDGFGTGVSRVLKSGNVFEQAGVNWSRISGKQLPPSILSKYPEFHGGKFYVTGVSIVIHPRNPACPTIHANYRFFQVMDPNDEEVAVKWWFGGGVDLTPFYLFEDDATFFHSQLKSICDNFHEDCFQVFSSWADSYFYIKHRKEHRGIGGLFFDYLDDKVSVEPLYRASESSVEYSPQLLEQSVILFAKRGVEKRHYTFEDIFSFVRACGKSFSPIYKAIITRRKDTPFTEEERMWQLYRRGRYVEFNLLYDRGTVFGLQTGGRVESILMSLPPLVRFEYNYSPEVGSREEKLLDVLRKPRRWHL